ncbi:MULTISPECIES: hypothetical protein [Streptomyces]|nr:hypothetical protein [Streptomyces durhamensis]
MRWASSRAGIALPNEPEKVQLTHQSWHILWLGIAALLIAAL